MANKKISELPAANLLNGDAEVPLAQSGTTVKATVNEIVLSGDYPTTDNIILSFVSISPSGRCTIGDLAFSYKGSPVVPAISSSSWSINVNPTGTVENMFDNDPATYLQIDNPISVFPKLSIMLSTPIAIDSITVTSTTDGGISIDQAPALIAYENPNAIGYSFDNQSSIWLDWATPGESKTVNSPDFITSRTPLEIVGVFSGSQITSSAVTRIDYYNPRAYGEKQSNPHTLPTGQTVVGETITIRNEPQRENSDGINVSTTLDDAYYNTRPASQIATQILVDTSAGDITLTLSPTANPQPDRGLNRVSIKKTFLNTGANNLILDASAFTIVKCLGTPTTGASGMLNILEYEAGSIFIWGDLT